MIIKKLQYQNCNLHDEPLNYLCLDAKCTYHRIICAICKQERHSSSHLTMPLKKYLAYKTEQLKCLSNPRIDEVRATIREKQVSMKNEISIFKDQIILKLTQLEQKGNKFFNKNLKLLQQCQSLQKADFITVDQMETAEKILEMVSNHKDQEEQLQKEMEEIKQTLITIIDTCNFDFKNQKQQWVGHSDFSILQSTVLSNNNSYKIAYLSKQISRTFNKTNFRILNSSKKWVCLGVCHGQIVQHRNYGFRYHTIGHGVYGISSNGGLWSHHRSECNNKLGPLTFGQNQIISIAYDIQDHKVIIQNEAGQKSSLETDENQRGTLYFCVVLYYEGDSIEVTPQFGLLR